MPKDQLDASSLAPPRRPSRDDEQTQQTASLTNRHLDRKKRSDAHNTRSTVPSATETLTRWKCPQTIHRTPQDPQPLLNYGQIFQTLFASPYELSNICHLPAKEKKKSRKKKKMKQDKLNENKCHFHRPGNPQRVFHNNSRLTSYILSLGFPCHVPEEASTTDAQRGEWQKAKNKKLHFSTSFRTSCP